MLCDGVHVACNGTVSNLQYWSEQTTGISLCQTWTLMGKYYAVVNNAKHCVCRRLCQEYGVHYLLSEGQMTWQMGLSEGTWGMYQNTLSTSTPLEILQNHLQEPRLLGFSSILALAPPPLSSTATLLHTIFPCPHSSTLLYLALLSVFTVVHSLSHLNRAGLLRLFTASCSYAPPSSCILSQLSSSRSSAFSKSCEKN